MTLRVHLHSAPDGRWLDYLRERLDAGIALTFGPDPPEPAAFEILVAGRPDEALLTASPHLHTLVIPWSGLPETTRALLLRYPHIAVHNLHHNVVSVAEMTLALLLAAAKALVPMDRALRRHDWSPRYGPNPAVELCGGTALILGYGAIGRRVGRMLDALGMRVLAVRRRLHPGDDPARIFPVTALHDLLPRADVLIIAVPHTDETTGLIGAAELALLPPKAILVNVARGPVVEQGALYRALREGRLHAAGLDVWYRYPSGQDAGYGAANARAHTPPADYPFHELDNVVMSPHRAGGLHTEAVERARMDDLAQLLNAAARGEPLPNPVGVERGY